MKQNSFEKWMILNLGQEICMMDVEHLIMQETKNAITENWGYTKCLAVWKRLMMGQYEHQNNNMGNGWKHITYIQKNMSL